jgi:hypothetical protein
MHQACGGSQSLCLVGISLVSIRASAEQRDGLSFVVKRPRADGSLFPCAVAFSYKAWTAGMLRGCQAPPHKIIWRTAAGLSAGPAPQPSGQAHQQSRWLRVGGASNVPSIARLGPVYLSTCMSSPGTRVALAGIAIFRSLSPTGLNSIHPSAPSPARRGRYECLFNVL